MERPKRISGLALVNLILGGAGAASEVSATFEYGLKGDWPGIGLIVAAISSEILRRAGASLSGRIQRRRSQLDTMENIPTDH